MAKKQRVRRTFTDEFKQQLIREIEGGKKLVDVAKEHGLQPSQLSLWRKKLGKGGAKKRAKKGTRATASRGRARKSTPRTSRPASSSSSQGVAELERMIGQLTVENLRLRRELEELRG